MKDRKCETGCQMLEGGEVKHDKNCVHYPESLTKMYDDAVARVKKFESAIKSTLEIKSLWLPPVVGYKEEYEGEYQALYAMESVFKALLDKK